MGWMWLRVAVLQMLCAVASTPPDACDPALASYPAACTYCASILAGHTCTPVVASIAVVALGMALVPGPA